VAEHFCTSHFSVFICKKKLKTYVIFFVLQNCVPLCVGLSYEIPIKHIHVCGRNVKKRGKVQGVWILLQATVNEYNVTSDYVQTILINVNSE